jgi:hypothetical protein
MKPTVHMTKQRIYVKGAYYFRWKASGDGIGAHGGSHKEAVENWQHKWELRQAQRVAERMER